MKSIYGIDVAAASLDVRDLAGSRSKSFSNNPKGFVELLSWAEGAELFVMEATGSHHVAAADFLFAHGAQVAVANPGRAKHYGASLGIRNKTDRADAEVLARFAAANELPLYEPLPDWQRRLRALIRSRQNLVRHLSSLKVQAKEPGLDEFVADQLAASISFAQEQLKLTMAQMRSVIKGEADLRRKMSLLRSIPGVGEVLALTLLAEIGVFERFESAKKAAAFAGVCPAQRQSGGKRWTTRMSKAGNSELRKALYMPALAAIRVDGPFKSLFLRLVGKGKAKKSAVGAAMHKLVRVAYGVLKSGTPFIAEGVASA